MTEQSAWLTRFRATLIATPMLMSIALPALAEEPTVLRGRVLLPDGMSAAGAELYWIQLRPRVVGKPEEIAFEKRAAADDQGRFEFSWMEQEAPPGKMPTSLIACLSGYGVDWLEIVRDQVPPEAVLQLVADNSIRGRVIDTEGRRVVGAEIAVKTIAAWPSGSLDGVLARKENLLSARRVYPAGLLPPLTTVTDQEGRFELPGVGAERLVWVNISAPGLASANLEIVNRDGVDVEQYNQAVRAETRPARSSTVIGPVIEHVAEPELVIRGTVVTGVDRKPVVRASVSARGNVFAQTDETGRFELHGLRRGTKTRFAVVSPPAGNLLPREITLNVAVGQTVVETAVELEEGVAIEGRAFDKATMRGVESEIRFVVLPDNPYDGGVPHVRTDEEGRFRMSVPPGKSVLMAQVSVGGVLAQSRVATPYRQASFSEEDAKSVPITVVYGRPHFLAKRSGTQVQESLSIVNAVKVLNLRPGSGPVTCDLGLETGKTVKLAIEDEQGRPVTGVFASGLADSLNHTLRIAEASCDIVGLGPDRPRRIVILQAERHLAGSLTLTGDEPAQVTMRLSTTASITGRALDADGEPLAGAVVQIRYDRGGVLYDEQAALKTDGDGKFQEDNVLPGEPFTLALIKDGKFFGGPKVADEKRQLKPGERLELGEFRAIGSAEIDKIAIPPP